MIKNFVDIMCASQDKLIIGLGVGRMGYSMSSFIMRLSHLGFNTYMLGDTSLPRVNKNTIVLVNSSSGETKSILLHVKQCKQVGSFVILFTTNINSKIAKISDFVIEVPKIKSKQIMKTIYEQFTLIFFDYLISKLIINLKMNISLIENNHSILE